MHAKEFERSSAPGSRRWPRDCTWLVGMSLRPVQPLQAAPLLPLVAAKLRRTSAARLACVCRWVAPLSVGRCPEPRVVSRTVDLREAVELLEHKNVRAVWLRPLGRGLLVDRLVCGIAAGTTVLIDAEWECEAAIDVIV